MSDFVQELVRAAVPSILWILGAALAVVLLRREIRTLFQSFSWRMRLGAPINLSAVELGALEARPGQINAATEKERGIREDSDRRRSNEREQYYEHTRRIMVVHRLFKSAETSQLYDVLIYLVPARGGSLASVQRVEYFFGGFGWKDRIFPATDRARGFPVFTAAYGPSLVQDHETYCAMDSSSSQS
jgi:hypothetical protein